MLNHLSRFYPDILMTKKRSSNVARKTAYQSLEARRLLAGDVTVVEDVHLYIRGDQADNQFEIVVDGAELKVNGLNGTTINGGESYIVQSTSIDHNGVNFAGGLRAHLGPGSDELMVRDVQFESMSLVYGGTGDDSIELLDSQFGDRLTVQTYDGQDSIATTRTRVMGDFYAITLDGQDTVSMIDSVFDGSSIVNTGEHKDWIHSERNHYLGDVSLILPLRGDDTVQLTNPTVGANQLGIYLGKGDDSFSVDLTEANILGSIRAAGQSGIDQTPVMTLNVGSEDDATMVGFEKGELLFQSDTGGLENVTEGASAYTVTFDSGEELESTYIEQYAVPVVLEETRVVGQIGWSGTYVRDYIDIHVEDSDDEFIVEIYEDNGAGVPDVGSVTRFNIGDGNRSVAGEIDVTVYGPAPLYAYHAEVDFTMEAGKQYWVSIYTELSVDQSVAQDHWLWGVSIDPESLSTVFNQGYEPKYVNDWMLGENPYYIDTVDMDLRLRAGVVS